MIRRDYLVRMVQELTQALTRILFLKKAQDYPRAVQEVENVLTTFWKLTPDEISTFSLEQWIAQCRQEEGAMGEKLVALADLFLEQAELYAIEEQVPGNTPLTCEGRGRSQQSAAVSLGLYLEAVATPGTIISVGLLTRIEQLIEQTGGGGLSAGVLKRLLSYYETRGMLGKAEDVLFDWLATNDPEASAGGVGFYGRLAAKSDEELEQQGLPRDEMEEGREQLLRLSGQGH